jgi:pullulanase
MIRWRMKALHHDVYEYYRGLIALRRAHPMFRLETAEQVREALRFLDPAPAGCLGFELRDVTGRDSWTRALVLINPQPAARPFSIPPGRWRLFADGRRAGTIEIPPFAGNLESERAQAAARSVLILGEPGDDHGDQRK